MDLNRVPNEEKLNLCRNYFKAGFALLPFLWLINFVWFYGEAFIKPAYDQQKEIKKYVVFSGVGSFVSFVAIVTWIVLFQTNRIAWGEFADDISFIIPLGSP